MANIFDTEINRWRAFTTDDLSSGNSGGGDASAANQQTQITALNNILTIETTAAGRIGATDEGAPANDTASSGLNGRLQRIAQRITSLIDRLPAALIADRLQTDVLGQPGVARQVAVTATSASQALTTTVRRVSLTARTCAMRYTVGTDTQTANASTSHYIAADERIDIAVPANSVIGVIRDSAATVNGALEITELV